MTRQSIIVIDDGSDSISGDRNSRNEEIIINYSEEDDATQIHFVLH